MDPIDLRSDTVTRPTAAMRAAIADARVGDDVYGEDPTVNRLEAMAAERVGKEAAVFVPSGTMANQIAVRLHTRPGDVLLAGENAHILLYEAGGAAALSGVQIRTVGRGGFFDAGELEAAIPVSDVHYAPVTAVALENTHNVSGGRAWPRDRLERIGAAARKHGLRVHLDGARIFNAALACGASVAELAAVADTVCFCLSKGLGAPVGSLLCAERDTAEAIRRRRKMLGGGMRQAGVLAAAGVHALEHHVERLGEDHENAALLARGLAELGLTVPAPETNIVAIGVPEGRFPRVKNAAELSRLARGVDVLVNPVDAMHLRAVTHLDVSTEDVAEALRRLRTLLD